MGFKKSQAFEQIRVPMLFKIKSEDGEEIEEVSVAHTFRIPDAKTREEYQRKLLIIKGRKLKQGSRSEAAWWLWKRCVLDVEGYDDLPTRDVEGLWKKYFDDPMMGIHVESAVDTLMEFISADEGEFEKKSEPSSAQ